MSAEHPLCRVLKSWHSAKIWTFAECQDPALGKATTWRDPSGRFAECLLLGTRQRFESLPSARTQHSAKRPRGGTLGGHFAECLPLGTRQSLRHCHPTLPFCRVSFGSRQSLCRVPEKKHSAKPPSPSLGKVFAKCIPAFAECFWHSAKCQNPIVNCSILLDCSPMAFIRELADKLSSHRILSPCML